jgi:hypothetical protein
MRATLDWPLYDEMFKPGKAAILDARGREHLASAAGYARLRTKLVARSMVDCRPPEPGIQQISVEPHRGHQIPASAMLPDLRESFYLFDRL